MFRYMIAFGVSFGAFGIVVPREARAEDWYSDAKAVIEQLIEDDIAEQVIPNAAASIPGLCTFFPASISAIKNKRFNGLPAVVRKELADAAGYKLELAILHDGAPDQHVIGSKFTLPPDDVARAARGALTEGKAPAPQACFKEESQTWETSESLASAALLNCVGSQRSFRLEVACSAALIARDAVNGNDDLLANDLRRLAGALAVEAMAHSGLDLRTIERLEGAEKLIESVQEEGSPVATDASRKNLLLSTLRLFGITNSAFEDAPKSLIAGALESFHVTADPAAVDEIIRSLEKSHSWDVTSTDELIRTIIASRLGLEFRTAAKLCLAALNGQPMGLASREMVDVEKWLQIQPQQLERFLAALTDINPGELASTTLFRVWVAMKSPSSDTQLRAAVTLTDAIANHMETSNDIGASIAALLHEKTETVQASIAALSLSLSGRREGATFEQAINAVGVLAGQCKLTPCKELAKLVSPTAYSDNQVLQRIIRDIQQKNYGAAAGDLNDFVFAVNCTPPNDKADACTKTSKYVRRFIKQLSIYTIDSLTSRQTGASSEASFREAAIDLIKEVGSASGLRRATHWYQPGTLRPEFALRAALRPGHIGSDQKETLSYASIDTFRSRVVIHYSQYYYAAIHYSLIDLLGPFSEIATRVAPLRHDDNATWAFVFGFLVPRADLSLAIPRLSNNLVVGAGLGFRLFKAIDAPDTVRYCFAFRKCGAQSDSELNIDRDNFEASVFVKYSM
jgi:hypothetical protein